MPKTKVSEWSSTPANNTDIGGINIAEGCAPSGINNAIRELMAQVKDMQSGTDADNFVVGGNLSVTGTATGVTPTYGDSTTKFATTAFVQAALQAIYPVGSIYTNATNATNPATLFGFGTWTAFASGRVMVGFNASDPLFDTAEETGGSKDAIVVSHTHTASTNTTGSHNHGWTGQLGNGFPDGSTDSTTPGLFSSYARQTQVLNAGDHSHTVTVDSTGSSGTNANIQPYITVYMWKRTA